MKQVLTAGLAALMICAAISGCAQAGLVPSGDAALGDDLGKAQKITAVRSGEEEPVFTATKEDDLETFFQKLQTDEWSLAELPEDAEESMVYSFQQQKTRKLLDSSRDETLYELARISVYRDVPYVSLAVLGQSLCFEVPADTAAYLNHPEEAV